MAEVVRNRAPVLISTERELPSVKGFSGYVIRERVQRPSGFVDGSRIAYKTSADILSKLVTLVVTVAAARALSATDFGVMALAMTTGWILGVASDAGLPMYLATRVAQAAASHALPRDLFREVMRWRWRLGVAAMIAGAAIGILVSPGAALAFALIVMHQVLGAMLETLAHAYRGLGRTEIESTLSIGHRGAVALGALSVLALHPSLLWLGAALAVPPLVALVISQRIARRLTDGRVSTWTLSAADFRAHVAPLGAGVLLSALYFRCDVYFLERLHGVEVVGVYNAAYRIVDALRLFAAAALAVGYPRLCAATGFRPVRTLSIALLAVSAIVATPIYVGANPLLALIYGDSYAAGSEALKVLSLCVPFFYVNYALTHQLIAWDGQRAYLAITAAALGVNLLGNALLIPGSGMVGAAWSTLVTETVVCVACLRALRNL